MSRKDSEDTVAGVLIINKHQGVTSHKIVQLIRKLYNTRRVGHTGTLDPMATGVLPVLIGRAVKASDFLTAEDKEYSAEMTLGLETDTEDITGTVLAESDEIPSPDEVIRVCQSFFGRNRADTSHVQCPENRRSEACGHCPRGRHGRESAAKNQN